MKYARTLLLAIVAALLLAPPALAAKGFQLGVTAGEVTSSSAVLWGKATKSGGYSLDIALRPQVQAASCRIRRREEESRQHGAEAREALKPNTRYWFRFVGNRGRRSDVGTFRTAPKPKQNATIKFAWSGDQDFNPEPGKSAPYWNNGEVLAAA